ncbi:type II secretion system protein N [Pseudomonas sp. 1912-s]|uniref:type II secretion system protein N n=1 Tax=Pseudomonas sp. 1912-s TaxID=3033802 RepID=UPI0023DEBCB1|nr:type II secretion system protein N [Pseudomonas sp. 1912-s]MDF3202951.1 type II secretion system protein N [Pseudomonas sp. 1912-s]
MNERQILYRAIAPLALILFVLICVWGIMLSGWGASKNWNEIVLTPQIPLTAISPEVKAAPVNPPLHEYVQVWSASLFNIERKPDATSVVAIQEVAEPSLNNLTLTGVVVANGIKIALFKENNGEAFTVREGSALPSGWVVASINERQVEIIYRQSRQTLVISSPRLSMKLPKI